MDPVMKFLVGTWFICSTNFPMWTKGNKTSPTFNYSVTSKHNILFDEVCYYKNGKKRSIKGYDKQDKTEKNKFVWRGKGLLKPLKSKWEIVAMDTSAGWAIIYFTKTVFTPEGVDVISRTNKLDKETISGIKEIMLKDTILKKHVTTLKEL